MEIKSISQKIFKTAPSKIDSTSVNNSNHTNPFGVNFKGNIINADVFESSEKADKTSFTGAIAKRVSGKCKMLASAIVGSINSMNEAMGSRLNTIVSFGKRAGERVSRAWNYLNNTNLSLHFDAKLVERTKGLLSAVTGYSPGRLKEQPVNTLRDMFSSLVAERQPKLAEVTA